VRATRERKTKAACLVASACSTQHAMFHFPFPSSCGSGFEMPSHRPQLEWQTGARLKIYQPATTHDPLSQGASVLFLPLCVVFINSQLHQVPAMTKMTPAPF